MEGGKPVSRKRPIPTGPSEQYLRLLKGEISPEEYARSVEKRVDEQRRRGDKGGQSAAQRKRVA
jgi:hypothetical protein